MIKLFEEYNEYNQVKEWLDEMEIMDYIINDDLTVDVNGSVNLSVCGLTEIPIQFGNVEGYFDCESNNLTTLKGSPKYVGGTFFCSYNKLTSLEGCPDHIESNFVCNNNLINSLKYHPKYIGDSFRFGQNPIIKYIEPYEEAIKDIIKHQDDYGVYNSDGSLNTGRLEILIDDLTNDRLD